MNTEISGAHKFLFVVGKCEPEVITEKKSIVVEAVNLIHAQRLLEESLGDGRWKLLSVEKVRGER